MPNTNLQIQPLQNKKVQPNNDIWQIHMDNGSTIEFKAGSCKSSNRFVDDVQRYHRSGEKPQNHTTYAKTHTYEFEDGGLDTLSKTFLTIDITKILAIVRNQS
jgi:hypothetical protein